MPDYTVARARMLAAALPSGTDSWVALLDGSGTELAVSGYARVAHSAWTTVASVGYSERSNVGDIVFAAVSEACTVRSVAVYDAEVAGNLLTSAPLLDVLDQLVQFDMVAGDNVRIADGRARFMVVDQ